jgi:hypothetical protein
MNGITAVAHASQKVEEVSMQIIPAPGVSIGQALKGANPQDMVEMLVRQKENDAYLTAFRRKPIKPSIGFVDGVLYFRCPVPKGAPSIAFNIDKGVVMGGVRTIAVFDTNTGREWSRSFFAPPLDLSNGGVLTVTQQEKL